MKYLLITFLLLSFVSCEDSVTSGKGSSSTPTVEPICPEVPLPEVSFAGIQSFSKIKPSQVNIDWNHVDGAGSYNIIQWQDGDAEKKLVKTIKAPGRRVVIKNLVPDTSYNFKVVMMDNEGRSDNNEKVMTIKTAGNGLFLNNKSILFNGLGALELGNSDQVFPNKNRFSISIWFKTSVRQNPSDSDARLLTIHRKTNSDESALSVGVIGDNMFMNLRKDDAQATQVEVSKAFQYFDDQWHNIVITRDAGKAVLYIDGTKLITIANKLYSIGTFPAYVGAYSTNRKNFVGNIDEVSIWKSTLSRRNIEDIYNNRASANLHLHTHVANLNNWYRLGDDAADSINSIKDQIGNRNITPQGINTTSFSNEAP